MNETAEKRKEKGGKKLHIYLCRRLTRDDFPQQHTVELTFPNANLRIAGKFNGQRYG